MSYLKLKSGSDIRGIASDIFGEKITLDKQAVKDIVSAFVCWLAEKTSKLPYDMKISVGHDSRITAESISDVTVAALVSAGVHTVDCGLSSTPSMFMTTVEIECDAAIQITASHHPADRNGLKFFLPGGGLDSKEISEILILADNKKSYISKEKGKVTYSEFMLSYAALLRNKICNAVGKDESELPLNGYKIVVDAGNGAGGFYAHNVLEKLGADISGSQFLEPDGMFPNHIPNPENTEAMDSVREAVVKNNADFGIIFDTDVDRAGCVDREGEEINRNRLIALASYIVARKYPDSTIVTDSITSDGLNEYIQKIGCRHLRYKRGYRNVIDKAKELCDNGTIAQLAIETSGHAAFRDNYFLDDGAHLITEIIIELARGVDINNILNELKEPLEEREFRFSILCDNFAEYGEMVLDDLKKFALNKKEWNVVPENYEGVRVNVNNGWFLLRLSVHDPVMPINVESYSDGGVQKVVEDLVPFFEKYQYLDMQGF